MLWGGWRSLALAVLCCAFMADSRAQSRVKLSPREAGLQKILKAFADEKKVKGTTYAVAFVDLNEDGDKEAIVYFTNAGWCLTGGCTTLILTPTKTAAGPSFEIMSMLLAIYTPIRVLDSKTNGWHELATGIPGGESAISYNGLRYPGGWYAARRLPKGVPGTVVLDSKAEIHSVEGLP